MKRSGYHPPDLNYISGLFSRSHTCLRFVSRLLSILFPGICHGSGFCLSFCVSPYSSGYYFSGVLPISLPVSFRVYYTYFISFTLLVVLWFSFTWSFCSSLFYLKTLIGMQFGRFLRAGLSSNGSVRSRVGTVSIELFARLATRSRKVFPFGTTTALGPYVNSFLGFTHYAFGASVLQVHFALWHSTSASGPNRRVPPPRGSPPRCPSRAFPFDDS